MTEDEQLILLNSILDFKIPIIPANTRFWMIRTQKGYFYNEFITRRFVALAWNNIDSNTDFSENSREALKDDILMEYKEINRPSTVINKCITFIDEIKKGDILIIPSAGSKYITFAIAGEYFEDSSKTTDLERNIIFRIRNHDVDINDVSCPYKKRRRIQLLRTVKNEDLNYSLCRAISNYHGLSNMDSYANHILNSLYNCYSFQDNVSLVYSVRKVDPIRPREFNALMYGTTEILAAIAPEEYISTQVALNSPGDVVFYILSALRDNWTIFFGLLIFLGGGSVFTFKVPGAIDIIKSVLNAPTEYRLKKADADQKELEILKKKIEIYKEIKASGINPEALADPINALITGSTSLQVEPITVSDEIAANLPEEAVTLESHDTEEE